MSKTIVQLIIFKNTTPKAVYELYMIAKQHSIATGSPATISAKEGARYSAHGKYISGKNLQLIKDKLIVQSWRTVSWNKNDVDSTLIILLEKKGNDVVLHATHANLPDEHAASINKGWHEHYWKP